MSYWLWLLVAFVCNEEIKQFRSWQHIYCCSSLYRIYLNWKVAPNLLSLLLKLQLIIARPLLPGLGPPLRAVVKLIPWNVKFHRSNGKTLHMNVLLTQEELKAHLTVITLLQTKERSSQSKDEVTTVWITKQSLKKRSTNSQQPRHWQNTSKNYKDIDVYIMFSMLLSVQKDVCM